MPAPFFYHPRMLGYDFGPQHPLKPERLRRTIQLLERYGIEPIDPGEGDPADAERMHSPEYVRAVRHLSHSIVEHACQIERSEWIQFGMPFGFGSGDNPPFAGMFEASLAYLAGTVEAAKRVLDGAPLAFNLSGGLHHGQEAKASGFCIFNDPAIAVHILKPKFQRVAYVDIDLHHGDGVQWLWYDDPEVLTYSIHQDPRAFYPGTGFVHETGAAFTSVNVPLAPGTTGEVWLDAFERTALPALERFQPGAIVLQMGTDAHFMDPLGHLEASAQDWLEAVVRIRDLGLPTVAVGGGGYNLKTVPRMWASAVLTLERMEYEYAVPKDLAEEWAMPTYRDEDPPRGKGAHVANSVVEWLTENSIPKIGLL